RENENWPRTGVGLPRATLTGPILISGEPLTVSDLPVGVEAITWNGTSPMANSAPLLGEVNRMSCALPLPVNIGDLDRPLRLSDSDNDKAMLTLPAARKSSGMA